ncbi:MAG TPA: hypothetical protein VGK59_10990 [Ohtaekwangia sp.]
MKRKPSPLVETDYGKLPRSANKTADSKVDRIYKYYHDRKTRIELTEYEEKIRERVEKCWFLLCASNTRKQTADKICKIFSVSQATAYDDIANAMLLFGSPGEGMKDAKRAILESMALKGAKKAWRIGDLFMYEKFLDKYAKANQLDTPEAEDMSKLKKLLKPTQVVIVSDPAVLEKKIAEIQEKVAQDIDHEVIE